MMTLIRNAYVDLLEQHGGTDQLFAPMQFRIPSPVESFDASLVQKEGQSGRESHCEKANQRQFEMAEQEKREREAEEAEKKNRKIGAAERGDEME